MEIQNRLNYWRHYLCINTQIQFAEMIDVSPGALSEYEKQKTQPTLQTLVKIYLKLKPLIPDLHLEDLLDIKAP